MAALSATSGPPDLAGAEAIIEVRDLTVGFGERVINRNLSLDVRRGEVLGVVGASGTGKSVLMRTIVGLIPPQAGSIRVFGQDLAELDPAERKAVETRWGILFQQGALFSSLSVKQNIMAPMREHLRMPERLMEQLAYLRLEMVGLPADAGGKMPSELSGGMIKRVALARALALDPEMVFLDEPTSGLDPIGAADFDDLILTLQKTLGLTVFMVTHDLDSLHKVCDRIAALGEGKVLATGTMADMQRSEHPWLRSYFHGDRALRALANAAAHGR
jgi:phospholipid/cholesterol/gamma-HCH transport system ATP-binding protein